MDGRTALGHAIMSVPVPGAPPRLPDDGAAIGLSFLDSALRLGHVRRLTERLTVIDHRVARRITEVDVSLRMLERSQRRASLLAQELRGRAGVDELDGFPLGTTSMWVPVARISRTSAAPVDIRDAAGVRLPLLTPHETGALLASGLHRLLRGILDTLPDAATDSDLGRLLRGPHEAEWLIQLAIQRLLTERRSPLPMPADSPTDGTVEGQGARHRSLALRVLGKYADELTDYFELFDIALDNDLLIVALDSEQEEHLLTYETPMHVDPDLPSRRRLSSVLRAGADGYQLEYRSHLPSGVPAYHLVVETEPGVEIRRMYLATDCDARTAATLHADLTVLAERLATERRAPGDRGANKILELQMQTTLRDLAELVRRRRWECAQAGFAAPAARMLAAGMLSRIAVGGDGVRGPDGTVDSSILIHPLLSPDALRQAADELYAEELFLDIALENDPTTSRAHATWRGAAGPVSGGAPIEVRAGMLLHDSSTTGPRSVRSYALAVAAAGYLLGVFLADEPWPFGPAGAPVLSNIPNADAVIAVLLLVPGFLYTRLALPDPHSVAGHLRALPRFVANSCIGVVAVVSAVIAAGLPGELVQLAFAVMIIIPVLGALLLRYRRRALDETGELVRLGAPRWLSGQRIERPQPDVRFFSPLGGSR
jgi:hypothetical protein